MPYDERRRERTMSTTYQNPALTVDAVWIRDGRVLLVRRRRPPFRGQWALPGGFVELTETVEEALVREVREETGLSARPQALVGVYSGPDRDPRKPTTSVAFLVTGRSARLRAGDDAAEAAWVPLDLVEELAFDHARILADARRWLRRAGLPRSRRVLRPSARRKRRPSRARRRGRNGRAR